MQWFYAKNGQQIGPVTLDQLRMLILSGQVAKSDLVWREGMPNWIPASDVPELNSGSETGIPTPPPVSGATFGPSISVGAGPSIPVTSGQSIYNYLVPAILVTVLCCNPIGIVSIVFAAQVNGKLAMGDYAGAKNSANLAKVFFWITLALSILFNLLGGLAYYLKLASYR